MSNAALEKRLRAVESQLAELRRKIAAGGRPWWERIWGTFAGDPAFRKATDLGRRLRKSGTPPKRRKAR